MQFDSINVLHLFWNGALICVKKKMETGGWVYGTGCLLFVLLTLFMWWFWNIRRVYQTIEKLGLCGPKPSFLIGNMGEMTSKGFAQSFKEWEQEYGKVYGIYRSQTPSIVIHDPDMLREIMVKQFSTFPNRMRIQISDRKPLCNMLQFMRDDHWRHVRHTLSPSFSSGKLKSMLPVIQTGCRNLTDYVTQRATTGEEVDAKAMSSAFAMDATAGTGFGLEINCLKNPDEPFGIIAHRFMYPPKWIFTILFLFPYLTNVLAKVGISLSTPSDMKYMSDIINTALKERRQDKKEYKDHLQVLVDAERSEAEMPIDPEIDHGKDLKTGSNWKRRGLTEDEIFANSLNFLTAGYENTASGIAFLLYNLAGNPDCLKTLQKEVDSVLGQDQVDYRVVTDMPYLEMCLNETLRLYPPGFLLDRQCVEDTEVNGLHVPCGMLISIPVYSIHTNPDDWPDPLKFDPERHTPESRAKRHPFSFLPFGMGPRNCIGMRMSQMEVKMAVCAVLQKFSPVLCEKSVFPAKISNHIHLSPVDTMWVKFKPREC